MKKYSIIYVILLVAFNICVESNYSYDLKKDIFLGTLSLGIFIPSFLLPSSSGKDTAFQKDEVNPFDQSLRFSYNKTNRLYSGFAA